MNLTAHRGTEEVLRRLVVDAIALLSALRGIADGWTSLVDLGSGAGFPGLPIAILEPSRRVVLVEARERRHYFQRAVGRAIELPNVEPRLGRAEVLSPEPASLVIAQAMAAPRSAMVWGLRWTAPGGILVIPGAEAAPDPGSSEALAESGTGGYRVPLAGPLRSFWWGRVRG